MSATDRVDPAADERWMRRAMELAATARRRSSPNPWVGCVLLAAGSDGTVRFEGATAAAGGAHAEAAALEAALDSEAAKGSTVYVTLEPCSHTGRTPPCAAALIGAGVARVVVGTADPDPRVSGRGIEMLEAAGIDVTTGVLEGEVTEQLAPYLTHRRTGRPLVVLKLASTLDGRTAAPDGSSRWITGAAARADVHELRADSDAVLVGAGTVRIDDPALTVRLDPPAARQPLRVVLGRAPEHAQVRPCLELEGPLDGVLDELGHRGVLQVLVEGGPTVAHAFHAAGLVDRYVVYLAPAFFGGDDARPLFAGPGAPRIDALWRGRVVSVVQLGQDLRVDVLAR
jgi:diaminohydroxyphosphoribosylaminopyrimidine deaminase / 5-amino-6-(5-phosphoribosylamino)uracil reductase